MSIFGIHPVGRVFQSSRNCDGFKTFRNVQDQGKVTMKYEDLWMEKCLSTYCSWDDDKTLDPRKYTVE